MSAAAQAPIRCDLQFVDVYEKQLQSPPVLVWNLRDRLGLSLGYGLS